MTLLVALLLGVVFGLGLLVSGMASPTKVLAFLDFRGKWDPSLGLVMVGAIAIAAPGFALAGRRDKNLLGGSVTRFCKTQIDWRLVIGSAIFGVGWGIAGLCPGPSVVLVGSGSVGAIGFVFLVLAGIALQAHWRG
jgi:uncharacterized membrane protein YedE/YeeE